MIVVETVTVQLMTWIWQTGGTRTGELSLRQLRITQPMLNTLRMEEARLHFSLWQCRPSTDELEPVPLSAGIYQPQLNELSYLRIKVVNLSCKSTLSEILVVASCPFWCYLAVSRTFSLNLLLDPIEHVLYEGLSSDIPIGRLRSRETVEFDTPVTFISCGRFEMSGMLTDSDHLGDSDRLGRGFLKAVVHP